MPMGAQSVPINPDEKHIVDNWEFFYNEWDKEGGDGNGGQQGATSEDMFLELRKGDLLETLGLTKERMVQGDVLFFQHQLLFPMCDAKGFLQPGGNPFQPLCYSY
jgi:hypothetical protein